MFNPSSLFRFSRVIIGGFAIGIIFFGRGAAAQDSADARLPEAAKLALRARAGDVVKMEGDRKVSTHIHLEALLSEFSTETVFKDNSTYQYRGGAANGALQIEVRGTTRVTATNVAGAPAKPVVVHRAVVCTVKPNLEVIKTTFIAGGSARHGSSQSSRLTTRASTYESFGAIRLPEQALKPGDSWSGLLPITQNDDLKGTILHYRATLIGFEMYQNFPCAHVEVNYTYKGPLPAIDAQIRRSLPKGSKSASEGQLTGTETTYYVLDRGWPLNDQAKLSVALNIVITANDRQLEVGGTIDVDDHSAVNAYPAYERSLVPSVGASSN